MASSKRYKVDPGSDAGLPYQAFNQLGFPQDGAAPGEKPVLVLIWDIDETLVIFNSLVTGTWAAAHGNVDRTAFQQLGERWEASILNISDRHFFYTQIEEFDQTCIADVAAYDDGARLLNYDFYHDGFPPAVQQQQQQQQMVQEVAGRLCPGASAQAGAQQSRQEQHAATARPLEGPQQAQLAQQVQQQGACASSPALPAEGSGGPAVEQQGVAASEGPVVQVAGGQASCMKDGWQEGQQQQAAATQCGLGPGDLRRLAYRYRHISMLYRFGLQSLGTVALRREWHELFQETDSITGHWVSHAADLLTACTRCLPALVRQWREQQEQHQQTEQGEASGASQVPQANNGSLLADRGGGAWSTSAGEPAAAAAAAATTVAAGLISIGGCDRAQPSAQALQPQGLLPQGPSEGSSHQGPRPQEATVAGELAASAAAADVEVVHVAVTSGQLIPSLAKLLLFRLSSHFTTDRVYSSRRCGKARCFDLVRERWGPGARFVVIGDGTEEEAAAADRGWPYLRVLLTDILAYPAAHVLGMRRDALGGYGLTLPEISVEHIAQAAVAGG